MGDELFDTNILIDAFNGHELARRTLRDSVYPAISVVTWMELMAGAKGDVEADARRFLNRFLLLDVTKEVMEESVRLRRTTKLKLMDAIILATARVSGRVLVTRNTRDFVMRALNSGAYGLRKLTANP